MKSDMASISIFSAISTAPPEINAPVGVSRLVAFAFGEDRECGRKGDQISAPLILIFIASRASSSIRSYADVGRLPIFQICRKR